MTSLNDLRPVYISRDLVKGRKFVGQAWVLKKKELSYFPSGLTDYEDVHDGWDSHNRTCTRFPILPRSLPFSLSVQGVTVKTTKTQTGSFRHGWSERWRETRRREFLTLSLFLSTRIERSCGDRAYLTYGGPTFGIIYGREGPNRSQKKRCSLPPPTSLCLHRLWITSSPRKPRSQRREHEA